MRRCRDVSWLIQFVLFCYSYTVTYYNILQESTDNYVIHCTIYDMTCYIRYTVCDVLCTIEIKVTIDYLQTMYGIRYKICYAPLRCALLCYVLL